MARTNVVIPMTTIAVDLKAKDLTSLQVGDAISIDADGDAVKAADGEPALGIVTAMTTPEATSAMDGYLQAKAREEGILRAVLQPERLDLAEQEASPPEEKPVAKPRAKPKARPITQLRLFPD